MPTVLWSEISFTSQIRNHLKEKRPEQKAESLYFPFYTFVQLFRENVGFKSVGVTWKDGGLNRMESRYKLTELEYTRLHS